MTQHKERKQGPVGETIPDSAQPDEGREDWNVKMLVALRTHFDLFGDRRSVPTSAPDLDDIEAPPIRCGACGTVVAWKDWPDHFTKTHDDPRQSA